MNKYQQALEDLCITYDEHNGTSLGDDHLINNPLIKIIKEGLDKETPKKPRIEKVLWAKNSTSEQYIENHYCPNCNEPLNKFTHNYCNKCGTKIDWSDE